jgi:hypothetical protein
MPQSESENPYQSPMLADANLEPESTVPSAAEPIRSEHLETELILKQHALSVLGVVASLSAFVVVVLCLPQRTYPRLFLIPAAVLGTTATVTGAIACLGLRRFAAWSRWPLTILACSGLWLFPLGTAFGIQVLISVYLSKPPRLLSNKYEDIVKQTPHMTPRTSVLTWDELVLLILIVLTLIVPVATGIQASPSGR